MPLQLVQFVAKVKYKPILVNQNVKIVAKASTTKTVKTLPQQMTIAVIAKRAQAVGWQQRELNNAVVCAQDHTPILNKANALMQVRVNQVNLKKIKQVRVQIVPADILPCLYRLNLAGFARAAFLPIKYKVPGAKLVRRGCTTLEQHSQVHVLPAHRVGIRQR